MTEREKLRAKLVTVPELLKLYDISRRTYDTIMGSEGHPPYMVLDTKRVFLLSDLLKWKTPPEPKQ